MTTVNRGTSWWAEVVPMSPAEKKHYDETYQVTEFSHPDEVIETAKWGNIRFKLYLELEMRRWMEANLRDSWVRENAEGLIALFSWRKYYRNVE